MKKYFRYVYVTACMAVALSINAAAYLDPSVMTYAVQVVAGVLVAVGAVVGIAWRRMKKKVQDKLGIDENAKKEVEDEIVEFTDGQEEK